MTIVTMNVKKVENALDRGLVLRVLSSIAEDNRKRGDDHAAMIYLQLADSLSGDDYLLNGYESSTVRDLLDERERILTLMEEAENRLEDEFHRPAYVGTRAHEAYQDAVWHLHGEPDGDQ